MINRGTAIVSILIIAVIDIIIALFVDFNQWDENIFPILIIMASFCFVLPFLTNINSRLNHYYFRPFFLFLIGYFIVFFQRYYDLEFGLINEYHPVFLKPGIINKSLCYSILGLSSYLLGYYITPTIPTVNKSHNKNRKIPIRGMRIAFYFASVLYIIFTVPELLNGTRSQEQLEQMAGSMSNFSMTLYISVFFSYLAICVYNCKLGQKKNYKDFYLTFTPLGVISVFIFIIFLLLGGSRSRVIIVIFALTFALFYIKETKIKMLYIIPAVILGALLINFIGMTRSFGSNASINSRLEYYSNMKNTQGDSFMPLTKELAGSLNTFTTAVEYVPTQHDYLYATFHLKNLLNIIPFSSRFISFNNSHWKYQSSDYFITYIKQGENYTYGNGTSLNGDLYLSYGVIGIIIGLFMIGYLFHNIETHTILNKKNSVYYTLLLLIFVGYSIPYSRFGFLMPLQIIAFSSLFIYLYLKFLGLRI